MGGITRGLVVGFFSILVSLFSLRFHLIIFLRNDFATLGSCLLAALGFIAGLWAEKFDHMATVTNFVIVPLSFLSGTFYSIERLPEILQMISKANPFFYMIDGFRYSFIGQADGSITVGLVYLTILSVVSWFITYLLYKNGYKIKS
mgnify:CR=1 FL=1